MIECAFFGQDARLHHVGLAVESIRAIHPSSEILVEETQRVSAAFMRLYGVTIELLEPLGDKSPIARSLRDGVKLLHLCFEVPDLKTAIESCKSAGFRCLRRPVPAPAFGNRRIAWVFSKEYGLFELLERGDPQP